MRINQLLLRSHGRHGTFRPTAHSHTLIHLPLALPAVQGTHHHIIRQLGLLPRHWSNLPPFASIEDGSNAFNVSRAGSPHGCFHVVVNRTLHIKLSSNNMHQHWNLNPRSKPLGQSRQRLQLPQQNLGIAPLPSTTANNLQRFHLNRTGSQLLLLQCTLLLGLLVLLGLELGGLCLGALALFGAAHLVLLGLDRDDFHAFEPAGAAFEFASVACVGIVVGGVGIRVVVPVGGGVGIVRIGITVAIRSLLLLGRFLLRT
mmetsp:Transcript_12658/g.27512  ORF Transcript_12658/g.27512 Transcript_12658/m.27512 type:complete len:258 (-) Transcript_12658:714-1487(-)